MNFFGPRSESSRQTKLPSPLARKKDNFSVDVHSLTEYIACNTDNGGFPLTKTFLPHIIPVGARCSCPKPQSDSHLQNKPLTNFLSPRSESSRPNKAPFTPAKIYTFSSSSNHRIGFSKIYLSIRLNSSSDLITCS
jgi:hypothetical protein